MKLFTFLREVLSNHSKDTHCRCCKEELDRVGGHGMYPLGRGFCKACIGKILMEAS